MAVRGRPRGFDRDAALRRAMELFWERGYDATSIADLTAALGIAPPSLYAAFGSKEQLFREALELYDRAESATEAALHDRPTAHEAIAAALRDNACDYVEPGKPRGCMVIAAAAGVGPGNDELRRWLADSRRSVQRLFESRIAQGVADGDVPAGTDAGAVAAFYATVLEGLSLRARDADATREELLDTAQRAAAAWDVVVGQHAAATEDSREG